MTVSQINLLTDVWAADAIHIPGCTIGEIDAMSRLETQSDPLTAFPTLTPEILIHAPSGPWYSFPIPGGILSLVVRSSLFQKGR